MLDGNVCSLSPQLPVLCHLAYTAGVGCVPSAGTHYDRARSLVWQNVVRRTAQVAGGSTHNPETLKRQYTLQYTYLHNLHIANKQDGGILKGTLQAAHTQLHMQRFNLSIEPHANRMKQGGSRGLHVREKLRRLPQAVYDLHSPLEVL